MLVLQGDWRAPCDKAGEETDDKADAQPSQGDDSDVMDDSDENTVRLEDADGFPVCVVSQSA